MGDPQLADRNTIPDFSCLDEGANYVGRGYLLANVNYVLETDNIMDLSHIDYLHPGTLGSAGTVSATNEVTREGTTVWSRRVTHAELVPDFLEKTFGIPHGHPVDRRLDVRWDPPSTLLIFASFALSGNTEAKARGRRIANIFSPETENSTHYWYAISYDRADLGADGGEVAQRATDALRKPFVTEDLPMIEAVHRSMGGADFWALRPAMLAGDGGAVRARRLLDKLIEGEANNALPEPCKPPPLVTAPSTE
jgi:vanillate O-demethylase monooxygenase subunit